jgi:hypothetical protein
MSRKQATIYLVGMSMMSMAAQISAPQNPPSGSSRVLGQAFVGLRVEANSFANFTSEFSQNLFNNFYESTNTPVILRVGGDSMWVGICFAFLRKVRKGHYHNI